MRRSSAAFLAGFGALLLDVVACNSISGVGDFSFSTSSASASSGGGATTSTSTSTTGGTAGSSASAGGSGGGLVVKCAQMHCPVAPDGGACCFENATEFSAESGRCVLGPAATDGCITDGTDAGRETRIECSRPADCPTGHCCGTIGGYDADAGTGWYSLVACQATCDPSAGQHVVCDPDVGCPPNGDAAALACSQSLILQTGYFTCK